MSLKLALVPLIFKSNPITNQYFIMHGSRPIFLRLKSIFDSNKSLDIYAKKLA